MNIQEEIDSGIKEAMKAKDKLKLGALRGVKKEIIEAKTASGASHELSDSDIVSIVQKMVKQRKDALAIFTKEGRDDLAEKEQSEIEVLSVFLPDQITGEKLEACVAEIIGKVGATSMKEMGKVMGVASKDLAGKADGREISEIVKRLLS